MYKKWKDLPFGIKEASMEEILKHSGEKGPGDDLLDINFDDWSRRLIFKKRERNLKYCLYNVSFLHFAFGVLG